MDQSSSSDMIGRIVARTARVWRRALDIRLQAFGLTEATWLPLLHLSRADAPMRQKELAASLGLDGSTVARLLDGLQAAALIERREDGEDRRAKTIHLTPEAQTLIRRVESVSRDLRLDAIRGIPETDIAIAAAVLDRLCAALATPHEPSCGEDVER